MRCTVACEGVWIAMDSSFSLIQYEGMEKRRGKYAISNDNSSLNVVMLGACSLETLMAQLWVSDEPSVKTGI